MVDIPRPIASSYHAYVQSLPPRLHFSKGITVIPSSPGITQMVRFLGVDTVQLRVKKNLLYVTDGAPVENYSHIVELKNVLHTPNLAYSTFRLESEGGRFRLREEKHMKAVQEKDERYSYSPSISISISNRRTPKSFERTPLRQRQASPL